MDLKIIEIASNTKNNKILDQYTDKVKKKNPICGDEVEISLKIKENKIVDFGYQIKSCIYCEASTSLLSSQCKEKSIIQIKDLIKIVEDFFENPNMKFPKEWNNLIKIINKNNLSRKECLMLPISVLSKLMKNYE